MTAGLDDWKFLDDLDADKRRLGVAPPSPDEGSSGEGSDLLADDEGPGHTMPSLAGQHTGVVLGMKRSVPCRIVKGSTRCLNFFVVALLM